MTSWRAIPLKVELTSSLREDLESGRFPGCLRSPRGVGEETSQYLARLKARRYTFCRDDVASYLGCCLPTAVAIIEELPVERVYGGVPFHKKMWRLKDV